jgi:pimeloyl-ACP methyl ester carboxylesterase
VLGMEAYATLGAVIIAPPDEPVTAVKPEPTDPAVVKARIDALLSHHGRKRLHRIRCPALVLAAADDVLIPPHMSRTVAEAIAGAKLKILASGSHAFPRSRAADFNQLALEFLSHYASPSTNAAQTPSVATGEKESAYE